MSSTNHTAYIILITLLIIATAVSQTTDDLIESYNYNYSDGAITLITQTDHMRDTNGNGINDQLTIELTIDATTDTYNIQTDLSDGRNTISKWQTQTLTTNSKVEITYDTSLLTQNTFNYTTAIYNTNNDLVFRRYKAQTNYYEDYEKGFNIIDINDKNINNEILIIELTINSTKTEQKNITAVLEYNISTTSATKETQLNSGIQQIQIEFTNETIKSTHHNGNYRLSKIIIGEKQIETNYTTGQYNYEDFAKTSYIKGYTDTLKDYNNNLSEALEINLTLNIKTTGTYTITYELYDEFENYITTLEKNITLPTGIQQIQTLINGTEIYKTKMDGPYKLNYAKLSSLEQTMDYIIDPYKTNLYYYTDFERPQLPDLTIKMSINHSVTTNITNITINLTNIGTAPAFNIFTDTFNNLTENPYTRNESTAFLDINQSLIYNYIISNSINSTLYTAIVDFDNLIEEINESNNLIQSTPIPEIISVNLPPQIFLPNVKFKEDTYNDTINLSLYVTDDEDSNKLNWSITGNNTNTIRVKIFPNKILNISSAQDYYNEDGLNITFIAKDEEGLTANDTILVIILSQNDPPILNKSIPNLTFAEDSNIIINLSKYLSDIDGDDLDYTSSP
ncbi:MAG: hypothetical protein AABY14_03470, partial [Nanoarchaeota archaeon]